MHKINWYLCWAFGHTGSFFESGYHVCSRCGLHGYWSFKENDPDCKREYSNAGHLVNWYWRLKRHYDNWRYDRKYGKDDIPF